MKRSIHRGKALWFGRGYRTSPGLVFARSSASVITKAMRQCLCLLLAWSFLPRDATAFVLKVPLVGAFASQSIRTSNKKKNEIESLASVSSSSHVSCATRRRLNHRARAGAMTMQDSSSIEEEGPVTETEGVAGGKKRVVVIGAGWAGLAAAYELSKQVSTWRFCTVDVEMVRCNVSYNSINSRDGQMHLAAARVTSSRVFWCSVIQ